MIYLLVDKQSVHVMIVPQVCCFFLGRNGYSHLFFLFFYSHVCNLAHSVVT